QAFPDLRSGNSHKHLLGRYFGTHFDDLGHECGPHVGLFRGDHGRVALLDVLAVVGHFQNGDFCEGGSPEGMELRFVDSHGESCPEGLRTVGRAGMLTQKRALVKGSGRKAHREPDQSSSEFAVAAPAGERTRLNSRAGAGPTPRITDWRLDVPYSRQEIIAYTYRTSLWS